MTTGLRTNGNPSTTFLCKAFRVVASLQLPHLFRDDPIGDTHEQGASVNQSCPNERLIILEIISVLLLTVMDTMYVEQDMFYGHSPSCLSWIYYMILFGSGPSTIIVSRCNANDKHYKKYVETLAPMPTMIYFIAPERVDDVSVITSMAGIIERSTNGDKLLVGRQEYSIEETLKIITNTFKDFKINDKAIRYNTFNDIEPRILLRK